MKIIVIVLFYLIAIAKCVNGEVTFTFDFDDTFKDGLEMVKYLDECGWKGSFFVNSQRLCLYPKYLTRGDVNGLYNDGHEIASHGLTHAKLIPLGFWQLKLQMCCDRALLQVFKWNPTSFAYTFAQYNHTLRKMAQYCRFCNARAGSQLLWHPESCPTCLAGDKIPPVDKWKIPSYSVKTTDRFVDLKQKIDEALKQCRETGEKRWVLFNFHKLCEQAGDNCNTNYKYSILREDFKKLVDYLKSLELEGLLKVKTMNKVIHESTQTTVQGVPRDMEITFDSDPISLLDGLESSGSILGVSFLFLLMAML